jgi:hypothetical protein
MMKWIKTGALAFMLALISFAAQANVADKGPMRLISKVMPDQTLRVQLVNLQQQKAIIQLTELNGKILHRDLVKNHNGYARFYDLQEVKDGKYLLKAQQGAEEIIVVIRIKNGTIMTSDMTKHIR